jgi:predicted MFS family arabinose efflux permease
MLFRRAWDAYARSFTGLSRDVWMLSLVMLVNRSGAMVIPFLAVYLTQELGFSKMQAGAAMSCFGVGAVAGSLGGGYLSDRFGYYRVQFWSLLLTGAGFLFLLQLKTFPLFCAGILCLSVVSEAFRPANQVAILMYSHPEFRTRSLSLNRMAINLGFSIGPALGGWLAYRLGFQWLFLLDALTCWGAAGLYRLSLKPRTEALAVGSEGQRDKFAAFRDGSYVLFLFFFMWASIAFMQFFYVVPVYLQEVFRMHEAQIGLLIALNGFIIVLVEMPLVKHLEGRFTKTALIQAGVVFIGASYLVYSVSGLWFLGPWLSIVLVTVGEILTLPFANVLAQQRSSPSNRGAYMALYATSFSLAHIIAPSMGLQVAGRFGYPAVWGLLAVLCVFAIAGIYMLRKQMEPV